MNKNCKKKVGVSICNTFYQKVFWVFKIGQKKCPIFKRGFTFRKKIMQNAFVSIMLSISFFNEKKC
uniref:Uncharacterized protein n=1 Tax=viral metagenome TaxID=1070528 RepID=A0A6C0HDK7_9ZZZZ